MPGTRVAAAARRYWVLALLAAIDVGVFAAQRLTGQDRLVWQDFGISNSFFHGYFWEPVTSIFVHLNLMHLVGNLVPLVLVGVVVLNFVGVRGFLLIYLVSGALSALMALALSPPGAETIGASGAIFGLSTAAIILLREHRVSIIFMVLWLAISVFASFHAGVSWQMHLGGALAGVVTSVVVLWYQGRLGGRRAAARSVPEPR